MGIRILERGDDVEGNPVVQPSDDLFWFRSPRFILSLIHFVLFENAFQLAFFAWSWYTFGYPSCFHENLEDMIIRIATGFSIQLLSSYVTLPLYALVTQMGSKMKQLKQGRPSASSTPSSNRPTSPLHASMPPDYLQHGHKKSDEEAGYQVSSPRHRDAVDFDRNDQLPEASVIEIEKDFGELHPEFTKEQSEQATLAASNSAQSF